MVVVAPGVSGDEASGSPLARRVVFVVGEVGDGDGDDALGVFEPSTRPGARARMSRSVKAGYVPSECMAWRSSATSSNGRGLTDAQVIDADRARIGLELTFESGHAGTSLQV